METKELHEKILYPVVRVRTDKGGGSGTIIYSKPNPTKEKECQTFVLTCAHVIDSAVSQKKEWDSLLKKQIEKEFTQKIQVEVFDYENLSNVDSTNSFRADIVAYDKSEDIAVLKIESPKKFPYIAKLIPKDKIEEVKLFTDAYACGCSLGHEPFANRGNITFLNQSIDNKLYWMDNCSCIFGNSGGAIFLADSGEQVGITARVATTSVGFGAIDIITWMAFSVAPQRIYEFFEKQELKFFYDPKDTYEEAMKRREKKQKEALLAMVREKDEEETEEGEPIP